MNRTAMASMLIDWYEVHQRKFPWRTESTVSRDPYIVWISESMLQKNDIETVIDRFKRWMVQFPTVEALAQAEQQAVQEAWEGLFNHSQVAKIHRLAQLLVAKYNGKLPQQREALLALPSIGESTASAILSIAFGQPELIINADIRRVLIRILDIDAPIDEYSTQRLLSSKAHALIEAAPTGTVGLLNEGLRELGQTLCTEQNPHCLLCPVNQFCSALINGTIHERPIALRRRLRRSVAIAIIWKGAPYQSQVLMVQQHLDWVRDGRCAFPAGQLEPGNDVHASLMQGRYTALSQAITVGKKITAIFHTYSHVRVAFHLFHAGFIDEHANTAEFHDLDWFDLELLDQRSLSALDRKIVQSLLRSSKAISSKGKV